LQLFVLFPNECSFYRKMCVEIFETDSEYEKVFKQGKKAAKIDFCDTLFYENVSYQWDEKSKRIAVLLTSVALYKTWYRIFGYTQHVLMGYGTGYLAALVCEGVLSLDSAIRMLRGARPSKFSIKFLPGKSESITSRGYASTKQKVQEKIIDAIGITEPISNDLLDLSLKNSDILMEIGPDNKLVSSANNVNEKMYSYFDKKNDCNYVLENVQYKKMFNIDYCVLRFLGMAASTKNYNEDNNADAGIIKLYEELKRIANKVRANGLGQTVIPFPDTMPNGIMGPPAKKDTNQMENVLTDDDYRKALTYMHTIFVLKKVPDTEVAVRLKTLEIETLIPVCKDYNAQIIQTHKYLEK